MTHMLTYIEEFNTFSICLRLAIATLFGGCIGLERGAHGQPAGIRTFSLVSLGACLSMITDEYLVLAYQSGDPARLAAQVISGIGFLGVGTIIVTRRNYVKGLTTAASLWVTACLGISIGSGYIIGSVMAFLMIVFVMTVLTVISHLVDDYAKEINLYIEVDKDCGIDAIYQFIKSNHFRVVMIDKQKKQALQGKDGVYTVKLNLGKRQNHALILEQLYDVPSIHYVEEIR